MLPGPLLARHSTLITLRSVPSSASAKGRATLDGRCTITMQSSDFPIVEA
jgi:hypothetical protein